MKKAREMPGALELEARMPGFCAMWDRYMEKYLDNMVQAARMSAKDFVKQLADRYSQDPMAKAKLELLAGSVFMMNASTVLSEKAREMVKQ